jgi:hypothetical protein
MKPPVKVRPEDISRRMFQDALATAYERVQHNRSALARAAAAGLKARQVHENLQAGIPIV